MKLAVAATWIFAVMAGGCGGNDDSAGSSPAVSTGGGGAGSGANSGGGFSTGGSVAACDESLLRTGLVAEQTGVSVDSFDCEILEWAAAYDEPDPMLFKAIIYCESRFDQTAVACPNLPCGQPDGWTAEESGCFGLMQVVPACGGTPDDAGLLPDGHPNLTTDPAASGWEGSIFHPYNNIHIGIAGIAENRRQVEEEFAGCSEDQYTLMAIGNYNRHGSTTSCTEINTEYVDIVLEAYREYAAVAGYDARPY